jgi:hypothetical protein
MNRTELVAAAVSGNGLECNGGRMEWSEIESFKTNFEIGTRVVQSIRSGNILATFFSSTFAVLTAHFLALILPPAKMWRVYCPLPPFLIFHIFLQLFSRRQPPNGISLILYRFIQAPAAAAASVGISISCGETMLRLFARH